LAGLTFGGKRLRESEKSEIANLCQSKLVAQKIEQLSSEDRAHSPSPVVYHRRVPSEENRTRTPGSERQALEGFLDSQREAVIRKIEGLDDATARKAPTASALSLLGIVKHCGLWERRWLQVVVAGRRFPGEWPEGDYTGMAEELGQDYLPTRPGTAAGVTLGLGVSIGGLAAPVLALIANSRGPRGALLALLVVPPLAICCGLLLRDPAPTVRQ
jgi:hypothetical protein